MAFSSDERLLCSTGAGGAVYFWDIASGSRLSDSEYVDKRCIYACVAIAGNSNGPHRGMPSAVVRAMDGCVQHLQQGRVEFELCGPQGGEASCMQLLGGDRVLLAADMHGTLPDAMNNTCYNSTYTCPKGNAPEVINVLEQIL
jgi:hypothetical protein